MVSYDASGACVVELLPGGLVNESALCSCDTSEGVVFPLDEELFVLLLFDDELYGLWDEFGIEADDEEEDEEDDEDVE